MLIRAILQVFRKIKQYFFVNLILTILQNCYYGQKSYKQRI